MSWSGHERNCFYLNTGGQKAAGGKFANVSAVTGFDFDDDGRAVATVDWDQDGKLDLWMNNRTGPQVRFLHNQTPSENHFLQIRLEGDGKTTNRDAIGSRLEVVLKGQDDVRLVRSLRAGEGYISQNSKWVHFGLGDSTAIEKVIIRWPNGVTESFTGLDADKRYTIRQGEGKAVPAPPAPRQLKLAATVLEKTPSSGKSRTFFAQTFPVPEVEYRDMKGNERTLQQFEGKPVLVNLWASWCPPCVVELKEWTRRQEELKKAGVRVLALTMDGMAGNKDPDGLEKAKRFLESLAFPFDAGVADDDAFARLEVFYKSLFVDHPRLPVPTSFLVDAKGRLAVMYKGPVSVEQLLEDAGNLNVDDDKRFLLALPFPGKLQGRPNRLSLSEIALRMTEEGRYRDAARYLEKHKFVLEARYQERMERSYPKVLYNIAVELVDQNRPTAAIDQYLKVIRVAPAYVDAHFNLGALQAKRGIIDDAIVHYGNALKVSPDHYKASTNLGLLLAEKGRHDLALQNYEAALKHVPNQVDLLNNTGNSLVALRRPQDALAYFSRALKINPNDARTHYNTGTAHDALGSLQDAIQSYTQAVRLDPADAVAHNNLGVAYAKLRRFDDAEKYLKIALKLDPQYGAAQRNLKLVEKLKGNK